MMIPAFCERLGTTLAFDFFFRLLFRSAFFLMMNWREGYRQGSRRKKKRWSCCCVRGFPFSLVGFFRGFFTDSHYLSLSSFRLLLHLLPISLFLLPKDGFRLLGKGVKGNGEGRGGGDRHRMICRSVGQLPTGSSGGTSMHGWKWS